MALKLSNNARSRLAAPITADAVTLTIQSGDEARFPTPAPGDWFPVTVVDASGTRENMRCTARAGVALTVTRGLEGTAAVPFLAGAAVELRLTSGAFLEHTADASRLTTGEVPPAVLPPRLRDLAPYTANASGLTATGLYRTDAATANVPVAAAGYLWHYSITSDTRLQEFQAAGAGDRYARTMVGGVWSAWYRPYATTPAGVVEEYAGTTLPAGYLWANGQAVSRTEYPELFAAIGTTFGAGNGTTSFNVPNRMGRVAAGRDTMGGVAAVNLLTAPRIAGGTLGAVGGAQIHALTSAENGPHTHTVTGTTDEQGAHQHPVTGSTTLAGGHSHSFGGSVSQDGGSSPGLPLVSGTPNGFAGTTSAVGDHQHGVTGVADWAGSHAHNVAGTAASSGSGDGHNNVQPTIIMNFIIKT